ncbi:MAG: hypothetical protein K0R34_1603 [Herbinix sp.]|jgi:preprotein translocase subunit SecE|nr:hypothetical protein [Herbinix sp.]
MIKHRDFVLMVILSIITCGIYGIIFWYSYSDDMNKVCYGDGKETKNYLIVILLSIITCGIYYWIWNYNLGNRLSENAPRYGLRFNEDGTTILLWMLLGSLLCGLGSLYAQYLLVRNMNSLADSFNNSFYSGQSQEQSNPYNNQQ